jgi:hypothetical protein
VNNFIIILSSTPSLPGSLFPKIFETIITISHFTYVLHVTPNIYEFIQSPREGQNIRIYLLCVFYFPYFIKYKYSSPRIYLKLSQNMFPLNVTSVIKKAKLYFLASHVLLNSKISAHIVPRAYVTSRLFP